MTENCKAIYDETNSTFGSYQELNHIKFYPIKLVNKKMIEPMYRLFGQSKNAIADKEILKMSYFKFLIYVLGNSNEEVNTMFSEFMKHITGYKVEVLCLYKKEIVEAVSDFYLQLIFKDVDMIDSDGKSVVKDVVFSETDCDLMRELILFQNGVSIEYIEEYDASLEDSLRFVNRHNSDMTFEEQIFSFCALMRCPITVFNDYTWYQFQKHTERATILFDYEIFKPLESSGQVEFKNSKLKHWLEHIPQRGRYDSILVKKEAYVGSNDLFKVASAK